MVSAARPKPYQACIRLASSDIMVGMRTIIDVDDALLEAAQAELGTTTKKDTVNEALRYVAERSARARAVLDDPFLLGGSDLTDTEVMSGARR
jgi:Arc/MetJ family transcription regulator